jgi:hypothetical protein
MLRDLAGSPGFDATASALADYRLRGFDPDVPVTVAPEPGAVWRVYVATLAFAALAGAGTVLTGGNYMFLRRKPAHASLLDLMGPWPVYILVAAAFALLLFVALAAAARPIAPRSPCGTVPRDTT